MDKLRAASEKYGREIRVFETIKASEEAAGIVKTDESGDLYEFTAEDYCRLLETKKADNGFKTQKIREAEQAALRDRFKKAVIRVRFPDNHTLEATFHPSETIQGLVDLLKKVIVQAELPFYIYTTPPKRQVKDMSQDFYSIGFVPGAIVYFSFDMPKDHVAHSGPFLKEELLSLKDLEYDPESGQPAQVQPPAEDQISNPPPVQEHALGNKPNEKRVTKPKWLKL